MNLRFRLLWIVICALFKKKVSVLDTLTLTFTVLPTDVDIFRMFNHRFFSFMDLGRTDFIVRTGLLWPAVKNQWAPIVASQSITFYRPLKPFQKFSLKTRAIGWDEKWFYFEQTFERNGKIYAVGLVKGLFRRKDGNVLSKTVHETARSFSQSPEIPEKVIQILGNER